MPRAKQRFRPNSLPANQYTVGDKVSDHIAGGKFRKSGKLRTTVGDLCDFCLQSIRIKRWFLSFRKKGYRFICFSCFLKKKIRYEELYPSKLLLEFRFPKQEE